ncbi:50S ribosomal protein L16 3-hydroxylase [Paraglaciecola mesophila]|uniref:50S ribosomal protein L16 3-hydroxylase n=1 Tax=Paraglaciecola mesophila TaxID=197222 RepID=A0A857JFQ4_9ALTE|nr:cupin domain-containing protein [Paraglaciecola mesophila]QHJ10082.1 50S ribosomal protein L16 3-hydroxylase [Paraglaciecola mesophila]
MYVFDNFDPEIFLDYHWQKSPAVFRRTFKKFVDPLDEHDLAGLAQDPRIDSRVVSLEKTNWQVEHGPIANFEQACKGHWSLLVQSVDQHVDEADQLIRMFNFIPYWRLDDLMVSFSNEGAGVGPHLDQYDVFIIQGKGSRRWQAGEKGEYPTFYPHPDLSQITQFDPIVDEILLPGDMIYIPAGCPHNGVALEDCMNYSVGFRAPSQQDLLSSFADYSIDLGLFKTRYQDRGLTPRRDPSELAQPEISSFRKMLHETIDSAHFERWLTSHFSHTQLNQGYDDQHNPDYTLSEILALFDEHTIFERQPGIRPVYLTKNNPERSLEFFIEGQAFFAPAKYVPKVRELLSMPSWQYQAAIDDATPLSVNHFWVQLMSELVNAGAWLPKEETF